MLQLLEYVNPSTLAHVKVSQFKSQYATKKVGERTFVQVHQSITSTLADDDTDSKPWLSKQNQRRPKVEV